MVATMANMPTINDGRRVATLRTHRLARGLTQAEVGALIGIGKWEVSRIENGLRTLTSRTRMQIEAAFRDLPVLHMDGDLDRLAG
jgi:transcriptional regulator with XRE-family HTH domain